MPDDQLPPLTGSDKQIAWATDIRARAIDSVNEWLAMNSGDAIRVECVTSQLNAFIERFTEARFWIDIQIPADHIIRKGMIETRRRKAGA